MQTYYTDKGQKVVIIGNLNSQEKIVQEIFIVKGKEVPSGENFVVKSLHDSPAISWKEKRMAEIEANYKTLEEHYRKKTNELEKRKDQQLKSMSDLVNSFRRMQKGLDETSFERVFQFLKSEITHVLEIRYSDWEIIPIEKMLANDEKYDNGLKLLTLFGKSDGSLSWRINKYSDGSGSSWDVIPFTSYDDALEYAKQDILNEISENGLTSYRKAACDKFNIPIDPKLLKELYEKQIKDKEKYLPDKKREFENSWQEINDLKEKLSKLKWIF